MGESFALRNWRRAAPGGLVSRIRPAPGLSRQDFRLDLHSDSIFALRLFQLRNFPCIEAGPTFGPGPTSGRESARVFIAQSGRENSCADRSAFTQWRGVDFLPRILVTAL